MSKLPRMVDSGIFISSSTAETIALGKKCGELLAAGDVLVLTGDLGAGKTQFTKGIARGMGITADVTSPTFTIEMVYEGGVMLLYHFDLYRLNDSSQLDDIGLFDAMESDGPTVIEWGEQFADDIGDERVDVFISRLDGGVDCQRQLSKGGHDAIADLSADDTDDISSGSAEPLREIRFVAHNKRGRELIERLVLFLH